MLYDIKLVADQEKSCFEKIVCFLMRPLYSQNVFWIGNRGVATQNTR